MVEIRIDNTGDGTWWLYNDNDVWKDYCGCDNFDEQVILAGNRHCKECTDAEWYQAAKDILDDIDCYDDGSITEREFDDLCKWIDTVYEPVLSWR